LRLAPPRARSMPEPAHSYGTTYRHLYYCCSLHCSPVSASASLAQYVLCVPCWFHVNVQAQVLQAGHPLLRFTPSTCVMRPRERASPLRDASTRPRWSGNDLGQGGGSTSTPETIHHHDQRAAQRRVRGKISMKGKTEE